MRCARGVGLLGDRGGCGIHGQSDGVGVHCTGRVADTAAVLIAVHSVSGGRREVCLVVVDAAGISPRAARSLAVLPLIAQTAARRGYGEVCCAAVGSARAGRLLGNRRRGYTGVIKQRHGAVIRINLSLIWNHIASIIWIRIKIGNILLRFVVCVCIGFLYFNYTIAVCISAYFSRIGDIWHGDTASFTYVLSE